MADPTWTDKIQAIASVLTAAFTAGSLVYLAVYTSATRKLYEIARQAHETTTRSFEEGARPVVVVLKVRNRGEERFAVLKNTGVGIAVNICRRSLNWDSGDSNVLAGNGVLLMDVPQQLEDDFIELRYESLTGKKLCTICCFLKDGRAFNYYIRDVEALSEESIKSKYLLLRSQATASQAKRMRARTEEALQKTETGGR